MESTPSGSPTAVKSSSTSDPEKGARVLAGGRRTPTCEGYFFEPTVRTDVTHTMRVMQEETFGPILPIMRVRDEEEAVFLANDSRYGLTA